MEPATEKPAVPWVFRDGQRMEMLQKGRMDGRAKPANFVVELTREEVMAIIETAKKVGWIVPEEVAALKGEPPRMMPSDGPLLPKVPRPPHLQPA
jgi:hypothetical protein